jgi:two-component system sensor histidine kinase DesK
MLVSHAPTVGNGHGGGASAGHLVRQACHCRRRCVRRRASPAAALAHRRAARSGASALAVAATVCCLPLQVWLVLSATRETRGRGRRWALVALAALVIGMIPVIGVGWLGALYGLTALVLVSVRPPWSLLLSAALVAVPTPVAFVFGYPEWALSFTVGVPLAAVPLAVVVWLVRVARQLQAARLALAREAIVRERLRIDDDLRPTVRRPCGPVPRR